HAAPRGRVGPGGRGVRVGVRRGADRRAAVVGAGGEPAPGGEDSAGAGGAAPAGRRHLAAALRRPAAPGPLAAPALTDVLRTTWWAAPGVTRDGSGGVSCGHRRHERPTGPLPAPRRAAAPGRGPRSGRRAR